MHTTLKKLVKKLLNISCIALVLSIIIFNSHRGMVIACNCIDFTALHKDLSKYLTVQDTHFRLERSQSQDPVPYQLIEKVWYDIYHLFVSYQL